MKTENPWRDMDRLTQRRADANTPHDIYWIRDMNGKYGFWISSLSVKNLKEETIKLKGITISKNLKADGGDLFLLLESNDDWEVFKSLCEDLISVTIKHLNEEKMISAIENRLKRWQQLLKTASGKIFNNEQQMGLLSELIFLNEILIPKLGLSEALMSWTGPDFDKQDFLLESAVIEVKSSKTSKGEIVTISSLDQLSSSKERLYLVFYKLSPSNNGFTVEDYIEDLKNKYFYAVPQILEAFDSKIVQYGYISDLNPSLEKFQIDKKKAFRVTGNFPRIIPSQVDSRILSVVYKIDLSRLTEFEIGYDNTLKEELP